MRNKIKPSISRIRKQQVENFIKNYQHKPIKQLRIDIERGISLDKQLILKPISNNVLNMILDVIGISNEVNSILIDNKNNCFWFNKSFDEVEYDIQEYLFHMNDMDWLEYEFIESKLS